MHDHHEVIVIGGSFAGLSAAMQLARARRRVLVIDAGQPRNRFAAHAHGFFGQDGKPPAAIVEEAAAQLAAYPTVQRIAGDVRAAERDADGRFHVTLADGSRASADRLILATGIRDELPALPGLAERWGVSVLHCPYCHGYEVSGQRLGVLATHPLSVHQAILIPDWGPATWFTQGVVEANEEEAALLDARGVRIERSPVVEILGDAPRIDALRLADGQVVPIDALFVGARTAMASDLAQQLGCAFDDGPLGPVVRVDAMKQTSVAGVFAAGDASTPMTNATFASASGVMAGVAAHRSLIVGLGR
ncbi:MULTISPECIES: NAD(P)/FAD-dependent oxidoreductase [Burkholderia]|uniref:NAD(P)/FAD-dependent oxidoreductase n=1 Tax=Burkholderia contaminans TaxID=488447 RepID=A0A2S5E336_9BURK|nr:MULTISPECIES: NAD(P)/FAD-dependent oxidoreductase [Burkholderia]EKS9799028.1 NAD(P)/FAD-dependent oxidoreductase [Burkholderia cepacia]EKS9805982.1 NAD(P)/FAD-dependent oxidoreductase [Burkholderia cepacia]EKS9813530.1 NAD(P)/FAD-dependent oxidoreductase [Burkholderia cepacia]EKS9821634.1 NAD(P)/FAD-dependent oxidoreductase [Burkholderia cepacia]EKS9827914.1 NAD(P)/FAD-dependent oxidoreductase [Burkholderia cepacia]